jgi:hypothetical protein
VLPGSPADFGKLMVDETQKWASVIKFANVKSADHHLAVDRGLGAQSVLLSTPGNPGDQSQSQQGGGSECTSSCLRQ